IVKSKDLTPNGTTIGVAEPVKALVDVNKRAKKKIPVGGVFEDRLLLIVNPDPRRVGPRYVIASSMISFQKRHILRPYSLSFGGKFKRILLRQLPQRVTSIGFHDIAMWF